MIAYAPVGTPVFSMSCVRSSSLLLVSVAANSSTRRRDLGNFSRIFATTGCSGATATNVAPNTVSMRVVNTSICASTFSTSNANVTPSLLPIQLRCIVRMRSGQPSSRSSPASSRST